MENKLKILVFGDIFAKYGRKLIASELPHFKKEYKPDFIIANGENAAHARGLTKKVYDELINSGIDVLTGGNHIFDNRDIYNFIQSEDRIIRPANFPEPCPGRGYEIYRVGKVRVGVVNLMGTVFLNPLDNPFNRADEIYEEIKDMTDIIILDFHAEATSEKVAMGYHADGRYSAVFGTHTHVQTADARVLDKGTGFITDVGMCGTLDGVIGIDRDYVIKRFRQQRLPGKYRLGEGRRQISAVLFTFDDETFRCTGVERIYRTYPAV